MKGASFSLRALRAGAAVRPLRPCSNGGQFLLPLGAGPPNAFFVDLPPHALQQPMLEVASSSSSSTSSPTTALGAAVSAATDLLFASSSSAPPLADGEAAETAAAAAAAAEAAAEAAGGLLYESDGAGVPSALAAAAAIERDFANAYFLTGDISGEVYSRDCAFVDPTVKVEGLAAWRRNIALLGRYLDSPRVELVEGGGIAVVGADEGSRAEGDFARGDALVASSAAASSSSSSSSGASISEEEEEGGSAKQHAVVARWRLVAPVSRRLLPWRPVVDVQGVTVYRLAGEEEDASSSSPRVVVVRHTEAWDTSPWAAVAQLLVPGR